MDRVGAAGVAVGLAAISVVCAAVLFAAERLHTGPLDFLERYFGLSPDEGDGSVEALNAAVSVAIIVLAGFWLATKK
jgi:hypothetical protein